MFDFFGARKQHRSDELRLAILDGQIRAMQLVMGSVISLLPADKRRALFGVLKLEVGSGLTSDTPGFDAELQQLYNESMSAMLQDFIKIEDRIG